MDSRLGVARRANVPPFHVMDMIEAAARRQREHGDVLSLLAGQPLTGAPAAVTAEAIRLLSSGDPLGYTPATGILELREAIAGHHLRTRGIAVDPDDVVVTTGASGGFLLAFLAAFEAGDRVAMARPNYPCYRNVLTALGCEVVELESGPETRFQPTLEQLAAVPDLKGVVIASPANPTGTIMLPEELAAIATWCEANGVQLISDEIYHGIEYGAGATTSSAWETSREAVVFASFSKYFSMTGWRIGWMLVPRRLRRAVDVLTGNFTICPPALAQYAAVAAFSEESYAELDGHVARYASNRELLLGGLTELGIDRFAPADGAFYVYADVSHLTDDTMAWARWLLATHGVALAPGADFDTEDGHRFVRFSFAGDALEITRALDRLSTAVRG
ncbi:MAG: aminotransferase class I/II-fold pyridoxal phosphate-dependent enzyme [Nocardioides sp.]|uniref:aminotransferase class I/II-fold pyridoxal phosphate-dependent enzyme n=1 Tax=Nocardioides nematodiphilus TaxID=2849669 RepID=UPI001CDA275E|nr:aminotransferase class I/II-fold pyridoxal phosphate-dependent enzyme [Nocardioides nematodiphilus]MCA1981781.1 aminotransferase class I/II-fold pyridoxal phosphate-dependent enzyme [Nocardioides nematodiphilus]